MNIEEFYKIYSLDPNFDKDYYLSRYPETENYYSPYCKLNNIDDAHRLYHHYMIHGKAAGNKPHAITKYSSKDPNKILYIKPIHGIGNRIYNISSCYDFIKQFGFNKLKICWSDSAGFSGADFSDLFNINNIPKEVEFISDYEYEQAEKKYFILNDFVSQDISSFDYMFSDRVEDIIDIITTTSFCYSWFAKLDWIFPDILDIKDEFIGYLEPSNSILEIITPIIKQFPPDTIGLHARRGDAFQCLYGYKYQVSSDEAFIGLIHLLDETNFFLATDCKKTNDILIDSTNKNIMCIDKQFVKDSLTDIDYKPYQQDAAIELFLLSHTKKIYGTNYSTFGKLAAKIGKIDFEEVLHTKYGGSYEIDLPNLSLTVGVKNRFNALKLSIHSWLQHDDIKEILIVDWDSDDMDHEYLESLDDRIRILRFENKPEYNIAQVLNVCINNSKYDHVLKMDVDYILNPYFSIRQWLHLDWEKEFLSAIWTQKSLDNGLGFMENLNGFLAVKKEHIINVGGYDENFIGYGWEDCDIRNKLVYEGDIKLKILKIEPNYVPIYHNPHLDIDRTRYQKIKDREESIEFNRQQSKYKTSI